jgi:hypothetical protein
MRTFAVPRTERRAIASGENPVALNEKRHKKIQRIYESDRVSPLRDSVALSLRDGKCAQKPGDTILDTTSVDVPICSERAKRRASALARRPRARRLLQRASAGHKKTNKK